jgi:5-guanidino-2-oxopentanoate decarboxylase
MEHPRSWLYPVGFGTLGYALPAAIGAKLARPERPAVALVGDSGLLYTVQELATAVELDLQLALLLWNNDALGQIRDDMMRRQMSAIAVHPRNPDFVRLAQAFGCRSFKPGDLDQLESDLTEALQHPGPSLVEVREDMPDLYT